MGNQHRFFFFNIDFSLMKSTEYIHKKVSHENIDYSQQKTDKFYIILTSIKIKILEKVSNDLIQESKRVQAKTNKLIRLPRKVLSITTRKSPSGNGTATFEKFEMRIHRRLIEITSQSKEIRKIIVKAFKPDVD